MQIVKGLLFFLIFVGAAAFYVFNVAVPDVTILKTHYPVVRYLPEEKRAEVKLQAERPRSWVPIKSVSKVALGAIVVSEDWAFFQHAGYDANQLQIALQEAWEKGKLGRGASTITQQVVKNVFLTNERSLTRKGLELYLSVKLDEILSKYKILEIYINIAEMGPRIYGIGPAAYYYFKKSPSELNAREGAFLAMLLPSPIRYGQSFREKQLTRFARRTIESILDKMVKAQYLSSEEREAIRGQSLAFEQIPEPEPEMEAAPEPEEPEPEAPATESAEPESTENPPANEEPAENTEGPV